MKKRTLLILTSIAATICFSVNTHAQTVGTLTFTFTEASHSATYNGNAQHNLAVWIQNTTGTGTATFVKSKLRYAGSGTADHLPTWAVNSGGTAGNCLATACNKTDAVVGATLAAWSTKTIIWDGKNVNGTANGAIVADGTYIVTIQSTWNHGPTGTVLTSYQFVKGPNPDHQTPANDANFTNIKLDWVPVATGLTLTTSTVNSKCNGDNTGSATATASGTPPYTYSWNTNPVQTTATATGLMAGNYMVTVKDASNTSTGTVTITSPSLVAATVTKTDANCGTSNGTASVTASGGTAGYTYVWSNTKTTPVITGLLAGIYSVTVTDMNGCTYVGAVNVLNSGAPTVTLTATNASSCAASDGSITSTVSGGASPYSYLWNNGKTTGSITGLPVGSYTLSVKDVTGCTQNTIAAVSCIVAGSADAGIFSISNPNGSICGSSIVPIVNLKNFGSSVLTTCIINYYIDNPPVLTYNWNGSLAPGTAVNFTLPSLSSSAGTHKFVCSTGNPNGSIDANTGNDKWESTFSISATSSAIPFTEGFESGTLLPSGWSVDNPDNDAAWEINTTIAHSGNNSIGFNNCEGNGAGVDMRGTKDRFMTGSYDFTSATPSANLSFDIAYAVFNYKGQIYTDSLAVFSSQDCGSTWVPLYLKGGTALSGITTPLSCWAPSAPDWRTENINLASLAGKPSVMFAFENRSDWGEWIYLDNINVTAITGIAPVNNPLSGFSIYPNPASTWFTIKGTSNAEIIHYSIYNVLGAQVKEGEITGTGTDFSGKIQVNNMEGMYFIKISDGRNYWTKKLSVQ
jgi:Secretion system C-terminal sorting domain/SprB repeat